MRERNLSRPEALEEYLVYRRRLRELLDTVQIARDIKTRKYKPRDFLGRGPKRFSETIADAIIGLFASLMDPQNHALNVFDVWLFLFPERKDKITRTWRRVKPYVQLIRRYRNDVVCHANKNVHRYIETWRRFNENLAEVHGAMQAVIGLAAELRRDEPAVLPNFREEVDPILRRMFPDLGNEQIRGLKDYFLGG